MQITDVNVGVEVLVEAIKTEYRDYTDRGAIARMKRDGGSGEYSDINKRMIEEFENGMEVSYGKKYIKILSNRSVWGFVVNTDTDKKFRKGDILKAAGYNAPARNAPRGNVFDGYSICWTGPHYLK